MPINFGSPRYIKNLKDWILYSKRRTPLGLSVVIPILTFVNKMLKLLEIRRLLSNRIIAVCKLDQDEISEGVDVFVDHLMPMVCPPKFVDTYKKLDSEVTVLYYSSKGVASSIAVDYLIQIASQLNEIRFVITGFLPVKHLNNKPKNVLFLGVLSREKFEQLLKGVDLVVFPLVQRSGVQTKLIKAMSFGKAIITTSTITQPFEGLVSDLHLIIEDSPSEFKNKIHEITKDRNKLRKLQVNALLYYHAQLENSKLIEKFYSILHGLAP